MTRRSRISTTLFSTILLAHALSTVSAMAQDGVAQKGVVQEGVAQEGTPAVGSLSFVESVDGATLDAVTSVELSPDGKFLYAAAWQAAAVTVFSRDLDSGQLTRIQELTDREVLDGSTSLRISPDGKHAVAPAFRSDCVTLFAILEDGTLELTDTARNTPDEDLGLGFCLDAVYSPDSKYVYVTNGRGTGRVSTFEITEFDTLRHVEGNDGIDDCFENVRHLSITPDGTLLIAAAEGSDSLVMLERESRDGTIAIQEIVSDENGEVSGLDGVMATDLSPDGRFVYVSSGRFEGDSAIGSYELNDSNRLIPLQEFFGETDGLGFFVGGNEIVVSPDGLSVYAVATRSSSMAVLSRNQKDGLLSPLMTVENVDGSLAGAAGVCVSHDGRFVYVAAEDSDRISVFRRQIAPAADGDTSNAAETNRAEESAGTVVEDPANDSDNASGNDSNKSRDAAPNVGTSSEDPGV